MERNGGRERERERGGGQANRQTDRQTDRQAAIPFHHPALSHFFVIHVCIVFVTIRSDPHTCSILK